MRLAALQHDAHPEDTWANLQLIEEAAYLASGHGVDVLLTPELFVTGADPRTLPSRFSPGGLAALQDALRGIASGSGVALAYALPQQRDRQWFIVASFLDAHGDQLASYTRVHLRTEAEHAVFTAGTERPAVFSYQDLDLALSSGYDIQFPENARAAALAGARALLVPAAAERGSEAVAVKLLPTRAMENGIYLAWANHCSIQGGSQMAGTSTIVGPDGQNIQVAGTAPQLILADVDPIRQQSVRKAEPYLARLHPEVYAAPEFPR